MKVLFAAIGKPGFNTDLAKKLYDESVSRIQSRDWQIAGCGELISDPDKAEEIARANADADAVIIQFSTFHDSRFPLNIMKVLNAPLLLWCLPEPVLGGKLQLNSLTGLNSATCALSRMKKKYSYVYTLPGAEEAEDVVIWLQTVGSLKKLRGSVIGRIGSSPPGFFASDANQIRLLDRFGVKVDSVDLSGIFEKSGEIKEEEVTRFIAEEGKKTGGLDKLDPEQVRKSTRVTLALKELVKEKNYNSVALRCWPEFVRDYKAVVCHSMSHLADTGIPSACESDILGSATMLLENYLSGGGATFLGDLVHVDSAKNSAIFWHCGFGPLSLASKKTGPVAGLQPNRNIGWALDNSLRGGPVTIARIGQTETDYRLLVLSGEAVDVPNPFTGVSVEVRFQSDVRKLLDTVIYEGYEFHYAIVWADIVKHLQYAGRILGIPLEYIK
ncbi:MAG: L-fucose/L-arabinose isomerase family protein [Spirochaetales bacterium]|jgi:L-fucose isomerase-like protein|nr:L-fucose/L-arabinose isomerase family protein [Spirochaetales bacterium]